MRVFASLAVVAAAITGCGGGPPTVHLEAGIHDGPLVLDRPQELTGEPGAVIRGGLVIAADHVTVRDVTVLAGEHGIEVDGAEDVLLERVRVSGATLDGIHVRRSAVTIRDCLVHSPAGQYAQGIDISFSFDLTPSLIEGCTVIGGQEGIVTYSARVAIRGNHVSKTTLRGISINEMSTGSAEENEVVGGVGIGIYCGDYSRCDIEANSVSNTRPDQSSDDGMRRGYGIVAHFGAKATLKGNTLVRNAAGVAQFAGAQITAK